MCLGSYRESAVIQAKIICNGLEGRDARGMRQKKLTRSQCNEFGLYSVVTVANVYRAFCSVQHTGLNTPETS